jgi:hypothetical protein
VTRSPAPALSLRARNRALLARQLLLQRDDRPALGAVEHLVGLQAQSPLPPYVALWSRLRDFDGDELGAALTGRRAVRLLLMRGTVHLVSAADALALRPLFQVVMDRQYENPFGKRLGAVDRDAVVAAGRAILEDEPLLPAELGRRLAARFPAGDPEAMAMLLRARGELVQCTPRGVWGRAGQAKHTTLRAWLGRDAGPPPARDELVLRYLNAFGPASVADVQTWCGLTRLKPVVEGLRSQLVMFTDDDGRELFDVPDAPRPEPETPAPVRFLGEFDNLLLSHADRSHLVPAGLGRDLALDGRLNVGTVLVDGSVAATWRLERDGDTATIAVRPFRKLTRRDAADVGAEAERLVGFLAADAGRKEVSLCAPLEV